MSRDVSLASFVVPPFARLTPGNPTCRASFLPALRTGHVGEYLMLSAYDLRAIYELLLAEERRAGPFYFWLGADAEAFTRGA